MIEKGSSWGPVDVGSRAARRVVVTGSRHRVPGAALRAVLEQAWGRGGAVLVVPRRATLSARYAARVWREWGGQVESHPPGWSLHDQHAVAGRRTWDSTARAGVPGPDVSVDVGACGVRVSEHDKTASSLAHAREVLHRHHTDHPLDRCDNHHQQRPPQHEDDRDDRQEDVQC